MHTERSGDFVLRKHRSSIYILTFLWTFGLSSGMVLASRARLVTDSWMCAVTTNSVSILSLLITMLIPFLISFVAFRLGSAIMIYLLAFLKSFLYGFSRCLMIHLFLGATWFLNVFLFFSDSILTVILLLYWFHRFQKSNVYSLRNDLIYLFSAVAVCIFDYLIVLPIWTKIVI